MSHPDLATAWRGRLHEVADAFSRATDLAPAGCVPDRMEVAAQLAEQGLLAAPDLHQPLDAAVASHVLHHHRGLGYPGPQFVRALLAALDVAQPWERAQLARGFPGYVAADTWARNGAWTALEQRAGAR